MRRLKAFAAIVLVSLMLAACTANTGESSTSGGSSGGGATAANTGTGGGTGRFTETDITPGEEEILGMFQLADGKVAAVTAGLKSIYTTADGGKNWDRADGPGMNNPGLENVGSLTMAADGTIIAEIHADEESYGGGELKRITPEGAVEDFAPAVYEDMRKKGEMPVISTLQALPDNKVYVNFYSGADFFPGGSVENEENSTDQNDEEADGQNAVTFNAGGEDSAAVYDAKTGEKLYDVLDSLGSLGLTYDSEYFYMLDYDGAVSVRNLSDGKESRRIESGAAASDEEMLNFSMSIADIAPDGNLYTLDNKGIYKKDKDSGVKEQIVNSAAFAFGNPSSYNSNFIAAGDNVFFALVHTLDSEQILRYEFDPDAVINPDRVLNVWTLKESSILRAAVTDFMAKYPDAQVNITVALDESSAQEADDAIRSLNTQILAGDGPDLILLDGCPAESYALKGLLTDLSDKVDTSGMYQNLVDGVRLDSGLYYIPVRFKVPMLIGKTDTVANMKSIDSVVDAVVNGKDRVVATTGEDAFSALPEEEKPAFGFQGIEEVADLLWNTSGAEIIKDAKVQQDNLKKYLESVKAISDKYGLDNTDNESMAAVSIVGFGGEGEVVSGSLMDYMSGRALLSGATMGDAWTLRTMGGGTDAAYESFPGLSSGSWLPVAMMGVSAKSDKQDFAAEFIQTMLEKNTQAATASGLPVTQEGYDGVIDLLEKSLGEYALDLPEFDFDMQSFVTALDTPLQADEFIKSTITNAAESYCKGETDLDSCVGTVESEVKNYLAERAQ